jgi:hypothetical protein
MRVPPTPVASATVQHPFGFIRVSQFAQDGYESEGHTMERAATNIPDGTCGACQHERIRTR